MRIAFLGLGRYSSGSPIGFHLAEALAAQHQVRAFIGREAANLATWENADLDTSVRRVYETPSQALASLVLRRRIRGLAADIDAYRPDVAIVPFFHTWIPVLARHVTCPIVMFVHDPVPHPGLVGRILHVMEKQAVKRAGHVVLHTASFKQVFCDRYNVAPDDVSVVPIGPLSGYDRGPGSADGIAAHDPPARVLFFGRMEPYKGLDVLLDVVPRVRELLPDATFSLYGPGKLRAIAERAHRTPGVKIINRWIDDDDVPGIFAGADVLVLPYTEATQSGVIPIAAAFGLPVIASDTGGLREQLAAGRCGVLVPAGDREALTAAIVELLTDPVRARALGRALRDEYQQHRSWASIAEAVAGACDRAVRATQGTPLNVPASR